MLTNKICARNKVPFTYTDLPLPIPNCRSWTSPGNTVFTQIVSSYNYERLIRSISTPNVYALFLLIFLLLFLRPLFFYASFTYPLYSYPSFLPLYLCPLYLYALFVLIFVLLYFYSLSFYLLLLSPLYVHIICTPFSQKIFPKKISTPKAYPKIFPKFLLIIITPPLYSSIGK